MRSHRTDFSSAINWKSEPALHCNSSEVDDGWMPTGVVSFFVARPILILPPTSDVTWPPRRPSSIQPKSWKCSGRFQGSKAIVPLSRVNGGGAREKVAKERNPRAKTADSLSAFELSLRPRFSPRTKSNNTNKKSPSASPSDPISAVTDKLISRARSQLPSALDIVTLRQNRRRTRCASSSSLSSATEELGRVQVKYLTCFPVLCSSVATGGSTIM